MNMIESILIGIVISIYSIFLIDAVSWTYKRFKTLKNLNEALDKEEIEEMLKDNPYNVKIKK